jgi:hypothetical protein
MKTPCLIIAFSRIDGIERLLASLIPSEISEIYLAIDGPTSSQVEKIQTDICRIVRQFSETHNLTLKMWQRSNNLGVAKGVITAIDWFYSNVEFGIILEDDLEVGNDFFAFVNTSRPLFDSIDNALLISGNQFYRSEKSEFSLDWTNYPLIWGWATSRNKWKEMRRGILETQLNLKSDPLNKILNFWRVGALRVRSLKVDTWDIPLANYMITHNKLCLTPKVNLISNCGGDRFASHTNSNVFPLNQPIKSLNATIVQESPSRNDILHYNKFLEGAVFKIRFRHRFIYAYYLLINFRDIRNNLYLLSESISEAESPRIS